ncbi:hypothetical protein H721_01960 [Brucella ovis IntaBari-2006-46-332]|nr:hypothetical protein [Brucella ovis]ENR02700.1 hypothetical protein C010_01961 [Brucella ovis 80/125]ENR07019.1 hypothetical protein C961_01934 [Brucella ovis F8/05B]ENS97320.1 hypothetical protein B999_00169 [Brucella ovis 63/96]ENS97998.1 hypothetical protein C009_01969 [Brucella ovis 81/8]ENT77012.1 hypothetical protein H712_01941 [Brucella ovis IntaBari-2009-88-4]ENT79290.1 hypothetical protein H720_01954 [Brucella ovis IntaBari-2006-46-348]ENT82843.1 hypothetical protein H713_01944 [
MPPSGFENPQSSGKNGKRCASLGRGDTDPLSGIDLPHFCVQEGHSLIAQEREGTLHRFLIRRK